MKLLAASAAFILYIATFEHVSANDASATVPLTSGTTAPKPTPFPEPQPPEGVNSASYPIHRVGKGGDWKAVFEKTLETTQTTRCNILFIGDSITHSWLSSGNGWKERYEPLGALNIGISGDRTQHILWRLQNGALGETKPKVIVLLAGINNTGDNTPTEIAEGITAIVSEIRGKLPDTKILLMGIFPMNPDPRVHEKRRADIKEVNEIIARLDDGKQVFFLDIGDKLLDPDGSIPKDVMPDGLHLSSKGYAIWGDAMDERLKELLATP